MNKSNKCNKKFVKKILDFKIMIIYQRKINNNLMNNKIVMKNLNK